MIGRWQCRHPIPIKDHKFGGLLAYARCNRCVNCILRRKALWTGRNILEWLDHGQTGAFITLTYSDEHVGSHSYKDIQSYLRNLRHLQKLRFYCAPDYGDQFGRFHWHLLLHNAEYENEKFHDAAQKFWSYGHVHLEPIIPERISYTCGYVAKKLTGISPGRQNQSLGLGTSHFLREGIKLATTNCALDAYPRLLKIGSKRYPIDATCRAALKKGFILAGGVPGKELDYTPRPDQLETVYQVLVNEKLGGSTADKITTDYFNGKTKTQSKTPKNRYYSSPKERLPDA